MIKGELQENIPRRKTAEREEVATKDLKETCKRRCQNKIKRQNEN
jgi:hypothetical protein